MYLLCFVSCVLFFFFFNDTATTEIYTLSLHDALPISGCDLRSPGGSDAPGDSRPPRSEEHTSELQSRVDISYAVFCLKKKKKKRLPPLPPDLAQSPMRAIPRHER